MCECQIIKDTIESFKIFQYTSLMHGEKSVLFSLECFGVNVIPSYEYYEVVIVVISETKHRT